MNGNSISALSPYRVLDLTTENAQICGRILSDLGADVIKVEPPGGDSARKIGPFINNASGPDSSLFFMAYNAGKRSVVLDIENHGDQETLKALVASSDFFLESFPPGYLKKLGLDFNSLEKINPNLVMASISPFGQTGPRAHWKGPDIVPWAMGGYMWMTGEPGRAPLRISHPPQAWLHAAAMTASACLLAHFYRVNTGKGQHIDVSVQQCPSWMLTNTYAFWDLQKTILGRGGVFRQFGANNIKTVWKALDGYITFMFSGGAIGAKGQRRVVELMEKAGMAEAWLKAIDWDQMSAFSVQEDRLSDITEAFSLYFETQLKKDLLKEAIDSGIMLAPVNTIADVFADKQLEAREYWQDVEILPLNTPLKFPGPPVKMSRTPWRIKGGPPSMGGSNHEMDRLISEKKSVGNNRKIDNGNRKEQNGKPLDGVRVLDFTSTVLGPSTTRYLADHGATVVKVESMAHPETLRIATPFAKNEPHIDRSGYFAVHNAGKYCLSLNMKKPQSRGVVEKLVAWADIVVESFAPGVMDRWGLDYENVKSIKPDIIMASTCLQGQTGPHAPHRGYGQMATAIAGWFELTGWPDSLPVGPYSAYSDFVDWNFLLVSILAALDHRRRTGEGQYIDQSQLESSIWFMMPAMLDYDANKRVAQRMGNRDPIFAPHGAYRCRGEDRWCAIAVTTEEEWKSLCEVLKDKAWVKDGRFQTREGRKQHEDELDGFLEEWTATMDAFELMEMLQVSGVPAGVVYHAADLFDDPQLVHRGHFKRLDHKEMGPYHIATSCFRLSGCNNSPTAPAPLFGEHTEMVLKEFLGMDDDEIAELVIEEVLS